MTEYPAPGTAKRPEARRLASLLANSRDAAVKMQLDAFNDPNRHASKASVPPYIWRRDQIDEIILAKSKFAVTPLIRIHTLSGNRYSAPIGNNDLDYVARLLEATYPGAWRYGTNREIKAAQRSV
jgi:hypothetical protein